jgi:hypothetical protein
VDKVNAEKTAIENKPLTREKRQPYRFKSDAVYDGEWLGSLRDGKGSQVWPDGAKYEGDWEKNMASGKGRFYHVDGDIFDGEW